MALAMGAASSSRSMQLVAPSCSALEGLEMSRPSPSTTSTSNRSAPALSGASRTKLDEEVFEPVREAAHPHHADHAGRPLHRALGFRANIPSIAAWSSGAVSSAISPVAIRSRWPFASSMNSGRNSSSSRPFQSSRFFTSSSTSMSTPGRPPSL